MLSFVDHDSGKCAVWRGVQSIARSAEVRIAIIIFDVREIDFAYQHTDTRFDVDSVQCAV